MFFFSIITLIHFPHYCFLIFNNYFLVITLFYHLLFLLYEVSSSSYYLLLNMLCCSLMVAIECFLTILLLFYFTTFYYYFLLELPVLAAAPDNPHVMSSILFISVIHLLHIIHLFFNLSISFTKFSSIYYTSIKCHYCMHHQLFPRFFFSHTIYYFSIIFSIYFL